MIKILLPTLSQKFSTFSFQSSYSLWSSVLRGLVSGSQQCKQQVPLFSSVQFVFNNPNNQVAPMDSKVEQYGYRKVIPKARVGNIWLQITTGKCSNTEEPLIHPIEAYWAVIWENKCRTPKSKALMKYCIDCDTLMMVKLLCGSERNTNAFCNLWPSLLSQPKGSRLKHQMTKLLYIYY